MKKLLAITLAAVILPLALNAQDIKVMSYNIRNSEAKDGTNSWMYRYAAAADMIKDQAADVIGMQEILEDQIYFIEQNFREYKCVGEYTSIFWNKKTMSMLKWDTIELPESECIATWALMKDKKSGNKFYMVNTDLGQTPKDARKSAVQLIIDTVAALNKEALPVVLTGGFDTRSSDAVLSGLEAEMKNARKAAEKTDNTGTYHNWGKVSDVIDHVYISGFSACPEYQTVTKRYSDRKFVSDHYPIVAMLVF